MKRHVFYVTFVAVLVTIAGQAGAATTISTLPESFPLIFFGEGWTATYGQSIIAPAVDNVLDSWSVRVDDFVGTADFAGYVMAWDGSKATGPVLWQSAQQTTTNNGGSDGYEVFTFNTGGLGLTPGGSYVLCERPDEGFAALHLGGDKEDYDILFADGSMEVKAGDLNAWNAMLAAAGGDPRAHKPTRHSRSSWISRRWSTIYSIRMNRSGPRPSEWPILLCMRTPGTPEELERQRFRAVALLDVGHRPSEVARRLGVSPAAVSQWKKLYQQAGPEGLKATPHPGPKPKLTMAQRRKLERLLLKGALAHGYPTDLWTLSRIAEVIAKHFAVS